MNRKTFEQTMMLFAATWPERAPSADTLAAYWLALNHVDDRVFHEAARRCLRECTFYPKPAEILARVETLLTEAGALPVEAERAWAEVQAMMRWHADTDAPRDARPNYSNALIRPVVDEIGGIRALSLTDIMRDLPHRRREFIDRYTTVRSRALASDPELMARPLAPAATAPQLASGPPASDNPLLALAEQIERGEL